MKAILIIDKNNVDSCLAATMLAYNFKDKGEVESIHATRHAVITLPADTTSVYILGVELTPYQMVKMLGGTNPNVVVNYRYATSENLPAIADATALSVQKYFEITPFTVMSDNAKGLKTQKEHYHDNCVSSMVYDSFLNCKPPVESSGLAKTPEMLDYVRFMKCVRTYFNMQKFEGSFDFSRVKGKAAQMADTDLAFFYQNVEGLRKAAIDGQPFIPTLRIARTKSMFDQLQSAKDHVARTSNMIVFSDGRKQTQVPVFNVSEEKAFEVMRLVSSTYQTVVTYEDMDSRRVWRVYSTNDKIVGLLMNTCEATSKSWSHGKITYFESEIPGSRDKMTVLKSNTHTASSQFVYTPPKKASGLNLAYFTAKIGSIFSMKANQTTVEFKQT
jgi:hypothetical protein